MWTFLCLIRISFYSHVMKIIVKCTPNYKTNSIVLIRLVCEGINFFLPGYAWIPMLSLVEIFHAKFISDFLSFGWTNTKWSGADFVLLILYLTLSVRVKIMERDLVRNFLGWFIFQSAATWWNDWFSGHLIIQSNAIAGLGKFHISNPCDTWLLERYLICMEEWW